VTSLRPATMASSSRGGAASLRSDGSDILEVRNPMHREREIMVYPLFKTVTNTSGGGALSRGVCSLSWLKLPLCGRWL
jgi:hypothetical protein